MLCRNKTEPESANQIGNEEDKHKDASSVLEAIIQVHAGQNGKRDEDSVGNLRASIM